MKIAFLVRSLNVGGAERQVSLMATGLAKRGHEVCVAVFYPGALDAQIAAAGVRVVQLGKRGRWDLLGFGLRGYRFLRAERADVVYSFLPVGNIAAALLRILIPSQKVVWGVRASRLDLGCYEGMVRVSLWAEALLTGIPDGIISNSAAGLDGLTRKRPGCAAVIPNGVDLDCFKADPAKRQRLRRELGVDDDQILVGMVARIDPMKDHPTFLRAAMQMRQQMDGLRFLCMADGSAEAMASLRALAEELGLADLIWLNSRRDVVGVYSALDLLVLSSAFGEGLPNVILEAHSCGLPVVATDVGGSAEAVGNPSCVARPGHPQELAEAALRVIRSSEFGTPAAAERLRQRMAETYSVDRLLERTERFLATVVTASRQNNNRVLFVIGSLKLGGAERHLLGVAPELLQRGWVPEIYVLSEPGVLAPTMRAMGVPVRGSVGRSPRLRWLPRPVKGVFVVLDLLWLLLRLRPAVCHCFLPHGCIVGGIAALLTRVPKLVMSRLSLNNYQAASPFQARIERFLMRRADAVLGNAGAVVAQLREEGIPDHLLATIYTGLDMSCQQQAPSRDEIRKAEGLAPDALLLMIVANLHDYKGHAFLFRALASIADRLPSGWRLDCVGEDAGMLEELTGLVQNLGIAANVRFLGGRPDAAQLWRGADIGLLVSLQEGFSLSILECMASGVPMVVTDVGGNAEAVIDGECGRVVPPADVPSLAAAILQYVEDPERRRAHGLVARQRVEHNFTQSISVDAYSRLYASPGAMPSVAQEGGDRA